MYLKIDQLPNTAAVWVFPCEARMSEAQQQAISEEMIPFLENWYAHEQPVESSLYVDAYQIVIFADTFKVTTSGCSIDKMHSALEACTKRLNVHCFYYRQILCQVDGRLRLYTAEEAQHARQTGELSDDTPMANVQVKTKAAFFGPERFFPLGESWFAQQIEGIPAL